MDLDIQIIDNLIYTNIFDKRNSFNFNIIKIPFWDSNLHISVFRNIVLNYIHRNNRLTTHKEDKITNIDSFFNLTLKFDYPLDFIHGYINSKFLESIK